MKLIIFDLDGTLLDTLKDITNSVNYTLKHFNQPLKTQEEIKYFLGQGPRYLLENAFEKIDDYEAVFKVYDQHYSLHQNDYTKPYDGVLETLNTLKKMDLLLAVCSNKQDHITKELIETLFPGMFDFVIGTSKNFKRKPSSDMSNHILKSLSIDKKDALYVGDTETDMKTALNSGLKAVAVTYGFRSRNELSPYKPYKIIDHLTELIKIVTK